MAYLFTFFQYGEIYHIMKNQLSIANGLVIWELSP